jgi:hypothetical protein
VVGAHPGAFLHDLVAERLAQRLVQQMRRRVVAHDLPPATLVYRCGRILAGSDLTGDHRPLVRDHSLRWLQRVFHPDSSAG